MMQPELIAKLLAQLGEELHDVQGYAKLSAQAEAAGDNNTAMLLELIRRDEKQHATVLHDILDTHAPDALRATMQSNPQLSEAWNQL